MSRDLYPDNMADTGCGAEPPYGRSAYGGNLDYCDVCGEPKTDCECDEDDAEPDDGWDGEDE